jgi:hypothetical protein
MGEVSGITERFGKEILQGRDYHREIKEIAEGTLLQIHRELGEITEGPSPIRYHREVWERDITGEGLPQGDQGDRRGHSPSDSQGARGDHRGPSPIRTSRP